MSSPYFFGAAVGGFLLMTAVGVPALVALCSSIPLAKRRKTETPGFDLKRAYHRITHLVVLAAVMMVLVTVLVIRFTTDALTLGYLFGLILAFAPRIKEMTPNNHKESEKIRARLCGLLPLRQIPPFLRQPAPLNRHPRMAGTPCVRMFLLTQGVPFYLPQRNSLPNSLMTPLPGLQRRPPP